MATNNLESISPMFYPNFIWPTNNLGLFNMMKECSRCRTKKHIHKFKVDKRRPDGRTITCRECYTNNKLDKFFRSPEQIKAQREKLLGRKYSLDHRLAISNAQLKIVKQGKHFFQKRAVPDIDDFRMRLEYRIWRECVIAMKGNSCEICSSYKRIHVHHIKCFYDYPEYRTDINNGQVLCQSCHMKLTWIERRKSNGWDQ